MTVGEAKNALVMRTNTIVHSGLSDVLAGEMLAGPWALPEVVVSSLRDFIGFNEMLHYFRLNKTVPTERVPVLVSFAHQLLRKPQTDLTRDKLLMKDFLIFGGHPGDGTVFSSIKREWKRNGFCIETAKRSGGFIETEHHQSETSVTGRLEIPLFPPGQESGFSLNRSKEGGGSTFPGKTFLMLMPTTSAAGGRGSGGEYCSVRVAGKSVLQTNGNLLDLNILARKGVLCINGEEGTLWVKHSGEDSLFFRKVVAPILVWEGGRGPLLGVTLYGVRTRLEVSELNNCPDSWDLQTTTVQNRDGRTFSNAKLKNARDLVRRHQIEDPAAVNVVTVPPPWQATGIDLQYFRISVKVPVKVQGQNLQSKRKGAGRGDTSMMQKRPTELFVVAGPGITATALHEYVTGGL